MYAIACRLDVLALVLVGCNYGGGRSCREREKGACYGGYTCCR